MMMQVAACDVEDNFAERGESGGKVMADVVGVLADEMSTANSKTEDGFRRMSLMADVSGESNPIAGSERERCVVYSQSCMLPHKLVCERAHTAATDKTPITH